MPALILVAVLAVLAPTDAWAQATDNDLPLVTIEAVSEQVPEGGDVGFTFTRTGDITGTLGVLFTITQTPHQVLPGSGFGRRFGEFWFARGSPSFTLTYETLDDGVARSNGRVTTGIIGSDNYDIPEPVLDRSVTVTVIENDTASTSIALTLNPGSVRENGGMQTVTVTAALDAAPRSEGTVVAVSVAGNTATVGADFGAVNSFNLTIPATQTSGQNTFTLTPGQRPRRRRSRDPDGERVRAGGPDGHRRRADPER